MNVTLQMDTMCELHITVHASWLLQQIAAAGRLQEPFVQNSLLARHRGTFNQDNQKGKTKG